MKKEVEISISGLHTGTEGNSVESRACGEYFRKDKVHYLFYEHSMDGSQEKVRTRLTFCEKKLELTRQGQVNTCMVFEEGERHTVNYATPYGSLPMEIDAGLVCFQEKEDSIQITVEYTIFMDGQPFSDSKIVICVREK